MGNWETCVTFPPFVGSKFGLWAGLILWRIISHHNDATFWAGLGWAGLGFISCYDLACWLVTP
ncbi:hypothetical protein TorRG33x02_004660 [Trema orientale]|uniref:Uncharacterized protein n=1 Tax=Trema orientale TaxID=63057 RepID=A0A2P5G2B0_TREOI|nr:hypothetical protein TorRG33x02_004660 [Trema orientale]